MKTVQDFIEEYYPRYSTCDDIAFNGDLTKLIHNEVCGDAEEMLYIIYDGDINNPQIKIDYNESQLYVLETVIEAYLETL